MLSRYSRQHCSRAKLSWSVVISEKDNAPISCKLLFSTSAVQKDWKKEWQRRILENAAKLEKTVLKENRFVAPPPPKVINKPASFSDQLLETVKSRWESAAKIGSKTDSKKKASAKNLRKHQSQAPLLRRLKHWSKEEQKLSPKKSLNVTKVKLKDSVRDAKYYAETGYLYAKIHGKSGLHKSRHYLKEGKEFMKANTPKKVKKFTNELQEGSCNEYEKLRAAMRVGKLKREERTDELTYQDLVAAHNTKRDKFKTLTFLAFGSIPFGSSLVALCRYVNPRKILPQTFWNDEQHQKFPLEDHAERVDSMKLIADHVANCRNNMTVMKKHGRLMEVVCDSVKYGVVLTNEVLLMMKNVCHEEPLQISGSNLPVLRALCKTFGLGSIGSPEFLTTKLRAHASTIREMDVMLRYNGIDSLTDRELRAATFMRTLNANSFSKEANEYWLENWLSLSERCSQGDVWFYYYSMVLHSYSFNETVYKENGFDLNMPQRIPKEPPKQLEDGISSTTLATTPANLKAEAVPLADVTEIHANTEPLNGINTSAAIKSVANVTNDSVKADDTNSSGIGTKSTDFTGTVEFTSTSTTKPSTNATEAANAKSTDDNVAIAKTKDGKAVNFKHPAPTKPGKSE